MIQQNYRGINIKEHHALPKGQMIHAENSNTLFVPDDGTYYTLVFIDGVSAEAVDYAIDFAIAKLEKFLNASSGSKPLDA